MRLVPSALALSLALASGAGLARPPVDALGAAAALPPERLTAKLREGHAQVNEALATRKARHAEWLQAVQARDEAAEKVERMKRAAERGAELEAALRRALVLDEAATRQRSRLMASEAEVARLGAALLAVYDAVLDKERRDIEALPTRDGRKAREVRAYQALADQRDQVRRALLPVLTADGKAGAGLGAEVRAAPDDDVETLLEKADLARDLEERFLRRASLVRRRIAELEEEQALARDVRDLVRSQSLFDEEHRRLVVVSPQARPAPDARSPVGRVGVVGDSAGSLAPPGPVETSAGEDNEGTVDLVPPAPADPGVGGGAGDQEDPGFTAGSTDEGANPNRGMAPEPEPVATGPVTDVSGAVVPQVTEQAFLGQAGERNLGALLASGRLTLPELRVLEKKLREEAARLRNEGKALRTQVKERAEAR